MSCGRSYTPFTTPSLLAEQINVLGTMPGSRMVFWDLRDDLDSLVLDPRDNMLYLSSAPDVRPPSRGRCDASSPQVNSEPERSAGQASVAPAVSSSLTHTGDEQEIVNGSSSDGPGTSACEKVQNVRDPCRPCIDEAAQANPEVGPDMLDVDEDGKPLSPSDQPAASVTGGETDDGRAVEGVKIEQPSSSSEDTQGETARGLKSLPPYFPLWTTARHSPDYCLATYLFWLNLHAPAQIHVQGIPLSPQPASFGGKQIRGREDNAPGEVADGATEYSAGNKDQHETSDSSGDGKNNLVSFISRPQTALCEKRSGDGDFPGDSSSATPSLYVFLKQRLYALVSLQSFGWIAGLPFRTCT